MPKNLRLLRGHRYVAPPAPTLPPGTFRLGVNLSGPENDQYPSLPTQAELAYFVSKGITTFRLPMSWANLQSAPFAALTVGTYLANIDALLVLGNTLGITFLLDIHKFGGAPDGTTIGGSTYTVAAFADFWQKMSLHFMGNAAVRGYDLMNEWAIPDQTVPFAANQACITAIRANGDATRIYIEGNNYSGAWNWTSTNDNFWQLQDPLNNLIFSAHCYLDRDSSGTHFVWATETSDPGESPPGLPTSYTIGPQRIAVFANWCAKHQVRGHIGECGTSSDNLASGGSDDFADWNIALDNTLAYCRAQNLEFDYWGAGPQFATSYGFCPEPSNIANPALKDYGAAGFQTTQMVVLERYSGYAGAQPTNYRIDAPLDGSLNTIRRATVGVATPVFRVRYNGHIQSPITITPVAKNADGVAQGGTFTPASVVLPPGDNAIATFTYTPAQVGTLLITATNDSGLTNPPALGLATASDNFLALTAAPVNIYALRRIYAPYIGPAVRLQRVSDGLQQDFYFNARGDLPRQAMQDWASARSIPIVTIYDQGPNGYNETYTSGNYPKLTLVNVQGYPEITWSSGSRMDFQSPNAGNTGQSIIARINDTSGDGYFFRQDSYTGPCYFGPSQYVVTSNPSASVSFSPAIGSWRVYAGTFKSGGQILGYQDGTQVATAGAPTYSFVQSGGAGTQMGYFRFYAPAYWVGSWTNLVVLNDAATAAQIATFASADTTYYSTMLPDTLTSVSPTIGGAMATTLVAGRTIYPMSSVTIADGNNGAADSATITLSDPGSTLSGTGITGGSGSYAVASTTDVGLQAVLQGLVLSSTTPAPATCTITITVTSSAGSVTTNSASVVTIMVYTPESALTPVATAAALPRHYKGVNLAGGENDYTYAGEPAGQHLEQFPPTSMFDHWNALGLKTIRLPFQIADVQPTAYQPFLKGLGTPLATIISLVEYARKLGMYVLLDPHNYGYIRNNLIGSAAGPTDSFVDFWIRMATTFQNYPNALYGLMNEPFTQSAVQWQQIAAAAVQGIRTITHTQVVFVQGTSYTGAHSWVGNGTGANPQVGSNGAAWAGYVDPVGGPIVFEMHEYLDSDYSGSHAVCVNGYSVMTGATTWLRANGFKGFLGEVAYSTDPTCATMGPQFFSGLTADADVWIGWTWWGAGVEFSSSYVYNLNPNADGSDQPQVATLTANLANTF